MSPKVMPTGTTIPLQITDSVSNRVTLDPGVPSAQDRR
jgi:hypothetical protein